MPIYKYVILPMLRTFWPSYFPTEVDTLEEFIKIVETEGRQAPIEIRMLVSGTDPLMDSMTASSSVGQITTFAYGLYYETTLENGTLLVFNEQKLLERWGSERGASDAGEREVAEVHLLFTAESRADHLRNSLELTAEHCYVKTDDGPLSPERLSEITRRAEELRVEAFPLE